MDAFSFAYIQGPFTSKTWGHLRQMPLFKPYVVLSVFEVLLNKSGVTIVPISPAERKSFV